MKSVAIASSSTQNQQTQFIDEMRKDHFNHVNVLESEIQTFREALQNNKEITSIVTNELNELKRLHGNTTSRWLQLFQSQIL